MKNKMRLLLAWLLAAVMVFASVPAWADEGNEPAIPASSAPAENGNQEQPSPAGEKTENEQPGQKPDQKPEQKPEENPDAQQNAETPAEVPSGSEQPFAASGAETPGDAPTGSEQTPGASGAETPGDAPTGSEQSPAAAGGKPGGGPGPSAPHSGPSVPHGSGRTMVINTRNNGRLNLRALPTTASASLGLFANGTYVTVYSMSNGWALVSVNGLTGYMATAYLANPGAPSYHPTPVTPSYPSLHGAIQYMVRTGNSGRLHLRQYASTGAPSLGLYANGTTLLGVDQHNGWVFVSVGGRLGYMMRKFLTTNLTPPPVTPVPGPVAPSLNGAVHMVVRTGNTGKLHLREGPGKSFRSLGLYPNGTSVLAKDLGNGWCYVQVNGRLGYMQKKFLSKSGSYVPPAPSPSGSTAPGTAWTYQKNGSYVNLRSSKASMNNSNVIARIPSGTLVTVLSWGKTYTKVQYNGMTGYIITSYLKR